MPTQRFFAAFLLLLLLLQGCAEDQRPILQQIQEEGEITVISHTSPTTYFNGPQGISGLEYELVSRFAASIGVSVNWELPQSLEKLLKKVESGDVHLAAAGLTITDERQKRLRFSQPYQTVTTQVVYLRGSHKPRKVEDLLGKRIAVLKNSSHEELLKKLKKTHPDLRWQVIEENSLETQFTRIINDELDYLAADSNDLAVNRRYYPQIRIAFNLSEEQNLGWAMQRNDDTSLSDAVEHFFNQIQTSGELEQLIERYYGHVNRLNFVDKRTFFRDVEERLSEYEALFKKASGKTGYDWRLLAAIGYQESHWNPKAKSPTGVRGLMMLTKGTAEQMGIKNRLDPAQSISGGARYLKRVEKKIPERIGYPDRLWLALAGYNVGFAHLEDARILTQRRGDNPDRWADVKKHLPSLSDPNVYPTLKYGFARGEEPRNYVDNIRNYYDLLLWLDNEDSHQATGILANLPSLFNDN